MAEASQNSLGHIRVVGPVQVLICFSEILKISIHFSDFLEVFF